MPICQKNKEIILLFVLKVFSAGTFSITKSYLFHCCTKCQKMHFQLLSIKIYQILSYHKRFISLRLYQAQQSTSTLDIIYYKDLHNSLFLSVIKTIHSKLHQIRSDKISADSQHWRGYFERCWNPVGTIHHSLSSDGLLSIFPGFGEGRGRSRLSWEVGRFLRRRY